MHLVQGGGIILGIVVAYLALTTVIGAWSIKYSKDTSSFMMAKNQMGTYVVGVLLVSEFIASASTLGTSQTAFETGISASWVFLSIAIGFLLYSFMLAGKYNETKEYTISGIIARKYGDQARLLVSLIMIFALVTVNVVAYTGAAVVLGTLLNIRTASAVWVVAVAATICVAAGGIRGVGFANIVHFVVKYSALVITAWVAWRMLKTHPGAWNALPARYFSMRGVGVSQIAAWSIGNIGAVFSTQYVIQSISSLENPVEAKKASVCASLWLLPLGFIAAYIGLAARVLFPTIKSVRALPEFLKYMNPWLAGIVATGILAVAFVTILACHLGGTALVMKDFYLPWVKPDEKHQIIAVRILAILLGILPIPFALYVPALLKTVFFARALRASLTVIVLFMFYGPNVGSRKGATIGLGLSVLLTTAWFALKNPFGIDNMYIAVATPFLAMLVSHAFRRLRRGEPDEPSQTQVPAADLVGSVSSQ
jgi:SSS family solute:Na+ symporter